MLYCVERFLKVYGSNPQGLVPFGSSLSQDVESEEVVARAASRSESRLVVGLALFKDWL